MDKAITIDQHRSRVAMNTLRTLFLICTVAATCFFIIYSFTIIDLNETPHPKTKSLFVNVKIYPTYHDEDLHAVWPFNISKQYNESEIYQWSEPKQLNDINPKGIGEHGSAFVPSDNEKELMEALYKEHNYNMLASDKISLHRSLPDPRSNECKNLSYPEKLPTTSVIIIFHNEAWTTLLRTVWSVLDRSPPELIEEIILVDDLSTWTTLKRPLDDYIQTIPARIKIIRTSKREGLIRARLIGAQNANGNVLTFLDGHIECCDGWLQPLLARIASDRSVIAVPLIDTVSSSDMGYYYNSQGTFINGFRWSLIFDWMPVPERELNRTHHDKTAPIRTPTMIGCSFSVDREFFFEVGSYDEGMNIWGSENMEMSLRVWQCGGSMEILPCSHVGHLFRISTYSFNGDANKIIVQNNIRLVEVWMSDLKDLYYAANPRNKKFTGGDLTARKQLKERLKCKDFRWYLKNVYPESTMNNEFLTIGEVKSKSEKKCIDCYISNVNSPLAIYPCHRQGGNQMFGFTKNLTIVTSQGFCVGADKHLKKVVSVNCIDKHLWRYDKKTKLLVHSASGLCMKAKKTKVILGKCHPSDNTVHWNIYSSL